MPEHTPGPWILFLEYNTKGFQKIVGGHWGNINIAQVVQRKSRKDEDVANAQLIAAAPALKALVVGFLATLDVEGEDEPVVRSYYAQNIELFNTAIDIIDPLVEKK